MFSTIYVTLGILKIVGWFVVIILGILLAIAVISEMYQVRKRR